MKFFKYSKIKLEKNGLPFKIFLKKLKNTIFEKNHYNLLYIFNLDLSLPVEQDLSYLRSFSTQKEMELVSSKSPYLNKYLLKNKMLNYTLKDGKKLISYKIYNDSFNLFFSFFENYNEELNSNYTLYKTYYDYSIKNKISFSEPLFVVYNLISFLQPSFIISFKKIIKKKKTKNQPKEVIVNYIKPGSRFYFCLKSIFRFSKTFVFKKKYESLSYTLLNLFLLNKNSIMYKKKINAYEKLIKLKKSK